LSEPPSSNEPALVMYDDEVLKPHARTTYDSSKAVARSTYDPSKALVMYDDEVLKPHARSTYDSSKSVVICTK
jgi:hypothetical protein